MQITLKLLKSMKAYKDILTIFKKEWPLGTAHLEEVFKYLDSKHRDDRINWLFKNLLGDINENLAYFKDCKNLRYLYLRDTHVNDTGLTYFKNCKNLISLNLDNTKISDIGLAHFIKYKNLTYLYLANTQISDTLLTHFKKIHPHIKVYKND